MTERNRVVRRFEWRLGRLLIAATYIATTLLGIGVVQMLLAGISPLAGGPELDLGRVVADLLALAPAGFLWLGLLAVIATPVSRVIGAAVGFIRGGEPVMALVAGAILLVIAAGVVSAVAPG